MAYDDQNIFAKILRGEIPCDKIYEDDYALCFPDIAPQAPTHVLIIPKGPYVSAQDFGAKASAEEITGFWRAVSRICEQLDIVDAGYRMLANHGSDGGQEVPHFHLHIFAGKKLGRMVS